MNRILLTAGCLFLLCSTAHASQDSTSVRLQLTNVPAGETVQIWDSRLYLLPYQAPPVAAEAAVDSTGILDFTLSLPSAGRYVLAVPFTDPIPVFLFPDDRLMISLDVNEPAVVQFEGKYKDVNTLLGETLTRLDALGAQLGPDSDLDTEGAFFASVRTNLFEFVATQCQAIDCPDIVKRHLMATVDGGIAFFESHTTNKPTGPERDTSLAEEVIQRYLDVLYDVPELFDLAAMPMAMALGDAFRVDSSLAMDPAKHVPVQLAAVEKLPEDARRSLLISTAIVHYMTFAPADNYGQELLEVFGEAVGPRYGALLRDQYQLSKRREGAMMPELAFTTTSGDTVRISDFAGKVVYVDVWASWCSPCWEEMPYSVALQDQYKEEKDVVFLFVNVDDQANRWKAIVRDDRRFWIGKQVSTGTGWSGPFVDWFGIEALPRYLLVDKQGRIARWFAPKPSSWELRPAIESLR